MDRAGNPPCRKPGAALIASYWRQWAHRQPARGRTGPITGQQRNQIPSPGRSTGRRTMRPQPGGGAGETLLFPATGSEGTSWGSEPGQLGRKRRHTEGRDPAQAAKGSMADRGPKWALAARSGRYNGQRMMGGALCANRRKEQQIRAIVRPLARATEESRPAQRIRAKAAGESLRHAVLTRRRPAQQAKQIRKAGRSRGDRSTGAMLPPAGPVRSGPSGSGAQPGRG
jgi:hypothetical protein